VTAMEYPAVELRTSPHIRTRVTTEVIMRNVVMALSPVCLFAVASFGLSAAALLIVTAGGHCAA